MRKAQISVVFGTRPEAIKLSPVILAFRNHPLLECHVCVTGQHRQMLDQVLEVFGITPDDDLNLMVPNQTLASFTSRALEALDGYFQKAGPDLVLVQGDTTTVLCAGLAAFYQKIPLGHVEAGLRTGNLYSPWPEEANRVLTTRLAALHFAPTVNAQATLLKEGVPADQVFVTGNTVIDSLLWVTEKLSNNPNEMAGILQAMQIEPGFAGFLQSDGRPSETQPPNPRKMVLVTGHRRESFGDGFEQICTAIRRLVDTHPEVGVIYPVHLNPNVQEPVKRFLGGHPRIQLIPPVSYEHFVWLMARADFILTDSGGVQEEAPSLGKPVLVMRDTTERSEGVEAGTCRLVGTRVADILRESELLLSDQEEYRRRSAIRNPYGDGLAARRIVRACERFLAERVPNPH